ncbi:hypothetical protein BGX30_002189 [Mortierella sp. GBA39]|nr:hypothetical protein BGX30_002189 [Mortierella sp. GBA39]
MNKSFDTWRQLNESTESDKTLHFACYYIAGMELVGCGFPWSWLGSLDAQADFAFFRINFEHFYLHLVAFGHNIGRFVHMMPSHFRHVNQSVNAAHINKGAELSQTLHCTFDFLSFLEFTHHFLLVGFELFFENVFLRQDHFVVLTVKLFYLHAQRAAFVVAEVFNEMTLYHGSRDKSACAHVCDETAFYHVSYGNFESVLSFEMLLELIPGILAVDRALGKNESFLLVVDADNLAFHFLTNLHRFGCVVKVYGRQFADRNDAVIFISNAYISLVVLQFDDRAFHGVPFFQGYELIQFLLVYRFCKFKTS